MHRNKRRAASDWVSWYKARILRRGNAFDSERSSDTYVLHRQSQTLWGDAGGLLRGARAPCLGNYCSEENLHAHNAIIPRFAGLR